MFFRLWLWIKSVFSTDKSSDEHLASNLSSRSMPQHVKFSAGLCKTDDPGLFVLLGFCYPSTLQDEVNKELSKDDVLYQGKGTSLEPVCIGDKILVSLSKQLIPQDKETENAFVK